MQLYNKNAEVPVTRNSEEEGPVPSAWRPALTNIVDAFVRRDYSLAEGVAGVAPVAEETAAQIREYIDQYGEALVALPQEAWETSVCIWMGDHWNALIDLWSEAEGRSDLVLQVHVAEAGPEYVIKIYMVYVP